MSYLIGKWSLILLWVVWGLIFIFIAVFIVRDIARKLLKFVRKRRKKQ